MPKNFSPKLTIFNPSEVNSLLTISGKTFQLMTEKSLRPKLLISRTEKFRLNYQEKNNMAEKKQSL